MMLRVLAFSVAALLAPIAAHAVTLDFDSGTPTYSGNNNLTGYTQGAFVFDVTVSGTGSNTSGANLFASSTCLNGASVVSPAVAACRGNDDGDLVPATQGDNGVGGNILILQEARNNGNPRALDDDSTGPGSITFTLRNGPAFRILGFSAIDEGEFTLSVGGVPIETISGLANRATGSVTFAAPSPLIRVGEAFTFSYVGSGGVDSIVLAPIPLPASALLLLAGVGGIVAMRRRRSA